jgi:hypothetical protein
MSANLCRRNVVVRDGPEGFTTFKLDTAAIAQKLLVGRAQLWSTEANCFVFSAVLVDSLSEVTMAVEPFFMNGSQRALCVYMGRLLPVARAWWLGSKAC